MTPIDSRTHPDFGHEARTLRRALAALLQELDELHHREFSGGDRYADKKLAEMKHDRISTLEVMLDEPYFGRMDLILPDSDRDQPFYISKHDATANGVRIISWATPVGGLFYSGGAKIQQYKLPDGQRAQAELLLKRQIMVSDGQLHRIVDLVDNRGGTVSEDAEEQFLVEQLRERGEMRLEDIVRTIQSEQNDLIRAPADGVMFIQGVAGSGKTSVAYYRLAYLLHPENRTGFAAGRTLILGPSPLFLSYTQELLPDLGVRDVPQTTFRDMALAQIYAERGALRNRRARFRRLAGAHQLTTPDPTFELLSAARLSSERERAATLASRARGSLAMRDLIRRYADELKEGVLSSLPTEAEHVPPYRPKLDEVLERQTSALELRAREFMEEACASALGTARVLQLLAPVVRSAPLGVARTELFKQLAWVPSTGPRDPRAGELALLLDKHRIRDLDERGRWTQRFEAVVDSYVTTLLPEVDAAALYYSLLGETPSLRRFGADLFAHEELAALTTRRAPGRDTIFADDLGAVLALHHQLFGTWVTDWRQTAEVPNDQPPAEPFRLDVAHLIVDEGRRLSPLEYSLLRDIAPTASMTVLGDVSQGVFDYRGVREWDEAIEVFSGQTVRFEEMHRSYRSTKEIVDFCNDLLRSDDGLTSTLATPVQRHGPKPRIVLVPDAEELRLQVSDRLADLHERGYTTIAVICRSPRHRRETARWLAGELGTDRVHELDATSSHFGSGVSVLTAGDAKGLEFEAALVVDADPTRYPEHSTFARKSLYVACTRALHALEVFAAQEASGLLKWTTERHAEVVGACKFKDDRGLRCLHRSESEGRCDKHADRGNQDETPELPGHREKGDEMSAQEQADEEVRSYIQQGMAVAVSWTTAEDADRGTTGSGQYPNWRALVAFCAEVGSLSERAKAIKYICGRVPNGNRKPILDYLGRNTQVPAILDVVRAAWTNCFKDKMGNPADLPGWWHGG